MQTNTQSFRAFGDSPLFRGVPVHPMGFRVALWTAFSLEAVSS